MPKNSKDIGKEQLKVEAMEYFMSDIFHNHITTKDHIDTKINWLMGISALIVGLLMPYVTNSSNTISHFGLIIIGLSALLTFIVCLLSLEMPAFFIRNRPEEESMMFYHKDKYKSPQQIYEEFKKISNYDDVLRQYSITLYNLIERNIKLKNRLFKLASKTLFMGLVMGFLIILIGLF